MDQINIWMNRTRHYTFDVLSFLVFCLLDQGPICGATDCPYFGLCVTHPWVSKPGWFSCLHTYLVAHSEPKGHVLCYTCFFTQEGCMLYKHVYSRTTFWTSLMQAVEGRQWWMLTWAAVRFDIGISGCLPDKWKHYPLGHAGWLCPSYLWYNFNNKSLIVYRIYRM